MGAKPQRFVSMPTRSGSELPELSLPGALQRAREEVAAVPQGPTAGTVDVDAGPLSSADLVAAFAAVDAIERTFAESLTHAIARLYLIGPALVVVGLGLTTLIPGGDLGAKPKASQWSAPAKV